MEHAFLKTREETEAWLKSIGVENYTIHEDLTVDVQGWVEIYNKGYEYLPVQFGVVTGDFWIPLNKWKTLKGCPHTVGGAFDCSSSQVTSLQYGPREVGGVYNCANNKLQSLEGCAEKVGDFLCSSNLLTSLQYAPGEVKKHYSCRANKLKTLEHSPEKIEGNFDCSGNELITLEFCPQYVRNDFDCQHNQIVSLEKGPVYVGANYMCSQNQLTSLKGVPDTVSLLICNHNQITSLKYAPKIIRSSFDCSNNPLTDFCDYHWDCLFEYNFEGRPEFLNDYYTHEYSDVVRMNFKELKALMLMEKIRKISPEKNLLSTRKAKL